MRKKNQKKNVAKKGGRGRPATGRLRPEQLIVYFSPRERDAVYTTAEKEGMTPGVWIRNLAVKAAGVEPEERD